jgi:hypothetical protein
LFSNCTWPTPSIQCQDGAIFQEIRVVGENIIQFIPFVHAFYALESPLFYNHHNHKGNIIVIPSIMGTQQGGPLRSQFASCSSNIFIKQPLQQQARE